MYSFGIQFIRSAPLLLFLVSRKMKSGIILKENHKGESAEVAASALSSVARLKTDTYKLFGKTFFNLLTFEKIGVILKSKKVKVKF